MEAQRWRSIKGIFAQALDRSPEDREAFLEQACDGDPSLRREVESLLASHGAAGEFLEPPRAIAPASSPSLSLIPDVLRPTGAGSDPTRIGPYVVLGELGKGGMGTVFLAERDDPEYGHPVAVKVVSRGMNTDEVLRRFHDERRILTRLDHPNIARILDGGTTDQDLPYFVMEYIEGQPIDRYCDAQRLTIQRRLELFSKVCAAVHFAHQNLVVHRDLKPGNILVSPGGTVKLLDFGIAKILEPTPLDTAATATVQRRLTPAYASPEQLLGQAITTASDVYSLGVLLYLLLTGRRPFTQEETAQALAGAFLRTEPPKPSSVVETPCSVSPGAQPQDIAEARSCDPRRLRNQLAGDLDHITQMALRPEPHQRYGSVQQLAEDLQRHLDGLPVKARQGTYLYHLGKFVRRNRLASVFIALVFSFGLVMTWQRLEIGRERDRANREASRAEQVQTFLLDIFENSDPDTSRGQDITAQEVLERGARRIRESLREEPEVRAAVLSTLGEIHRKLGLYDKAEPLLKEALAFREQELGSEDPQVADSLHLLAQLVAAKGELKIAEDLYQRSLKIRRKVLKDDHPAIAESLSGLGTLYEKQGRIEVARELLEEALARQRSLKDPKPAKLAATLNDLAVVISAQGDYSAAAGLVEQALAIQRRTLGDNHPHVATSLLNAGTLLYQTGDDRRAEPLLRESLALHLQLLGAEHPKIAVLQNTLAILLYRRGELKEAEGLLRQALANNLQTLGESHPDTATTLDTLAAVLKRQGQAAEAETLYRRALEARRKSLGPEHPAVASSLNNLAFLRQRAGDKTEAERLFRRALDLRRSALGEDHPAVGLSLNNLASLLLEKGDVEESENIYRQALELRRRVLPPGHPDLAYTLTGLGRLLLEKHLPEEASTLLEEAAEIRRKALPAGHWRTAESESLLGWSRLRQGRREEAGRLLRPSLGILMNQQGKDHPATIRAQSALDELRQEA